LVVNNISFLQIIFKRKEKIKKEDKKGRKEKINK
jgi:hypothetical protein